MGCFFFMNISAKQTVPQVLRHCHLLVWEAETVNSGPLSCQFKLQHRTLPLLAVLWPSWQLHREQKAGGFHSDTSGNQLLSGLENCWRWTDRLTFPRRVWLVFSVRSFSTERGGQRWTWTCQRPCKILLVKGVAVRGQIRPHKDYHITHTHHLKRSLKWTRKGILITHKQSTQLHKTTMKTNKNTPSGHRSYCKHTWFMHVVIQYNDIFNQICG